MLRSRVHSGIYLLWGLQKQQSATLGLHYLKAVTWPVVRRLQVLIKSILPLQPTGPGYMNPCLESFISSPSIHSKVEQFLFKVFEGVYVKTVILIKAGKKYEIPPQAKSLNFIYLNTISLDVYKVIHTVHMFPKELTHIP